jgi:adenylate cyclase
LPSAAAEQPTLAVLPFANLSGDAAQDYLSNVVTDNTVKTLAKVGELFVVAGGSPASQEKPLPEVAKELDVRYILQGGVQQSGDLVKMTATLSDATGDKTLWSEDYERELKAVFDLQDEITRRVVTSLGVQLTPEEQQRVWHRQTSDLEAYRAYLEGRERFLRFTKSDMAEAQKLYEKALALDPNFALAWAALGSTHIDQASYQWVEDPAAAWASATEAAQKALAVDESNAYALSVLGSIEQSRGDPAEAVALSEKAAASAPNDAWMNAMLGTRLAQTAGKPKEGLDLITKAMRLDRSHPACFWNFPVGRTTRSATMTRRLPHSRNTTSAVPTIQTLTSRSSTPPRRWVSWTKQRPRSPSCSRNTPISRSRGTPASTASRTRRLSS